MKTFLSTIFVAIAVASTADAQVQKFPYEAKVVVDEAYVRSGAGEEKFYPTDSLMRDTIVTVQRHDPGGWYMIDPPKGSFSWISQEHVRQTSADSGEVTGSDVIAMVGSKFGDETGVWQRKMLAGEKVTILDQRVVDTLQGPKPMFKIKPPTREYRWIPGSAVIPVGEQQRAAHDRNPYAVPSNLAPRMRSQPIQTTESQAEPVSRYSPSHRLARLQQIRAEQRQLQELDQKFRNMILSPPQQWDLDTIETAYRDLQDQASHKPVAGQIDLRFPAINRYRLRKAQLDELNELTSATERRDSELLAAQFSTPNASQSVHALGVVFDGMTMAAAGAAPFENSFPPSEYSSSFGDSMPIPEANIPFPASTVSAQTSGPSLVIPGSNSKISPSSRYIGAGYVQRESGNGDSYILVTPAGKVLAHLQADDSVNLEENVGKSVGLQGKRYFDAEVQRDRIEVSGLEPIRLRQ